MGRRAWKLAAATALVLLASVAGGAKIDPTAYTGSERCAECHAEKYNGWKDTFHATVVQDARKNPAAVLGDFTVPNLGFKIEDVEYTIGGHWDQRYMTKIEGEYYVLPKLWSVQSRTWQPYNVWAWRKKPYSQYCKGCHVTAYDPVIEGLPVEHRVGCEACHGPGRAHAEKPGKGSIVNPEKLPPARRDMVCGACHVRGRDPSGKYFFPIGFVAGEDLAEYYVPEDKAKDETNAQAIARKIAEWKKDRSSGSKSRCEVCGIGGASGQEGGKGSALEFCLGCHDFKKSYPQHTRHDASVELVCFDCHVQQTRDLMNSKDLDIHSYGYFLIHPDNCYDREIEKTCAKCHKDKDVDWARRIVEGWRAPAQVDH